MDFSLGVKIINKAYEERSKDRMYQAYCMYLPWMNEDNFMSFENFYNSSMVRYEDKDKEEVLEEVEDIIRLLEERR